MVTLPAQPVAAWRQQQRLRPDRQFRRALDGAVMRQRQQQRAEPHRRHLALTALDRHRHDVGVADEVGDEMAVRLLVQAARRAVLRDARHAHHHDAVGDRQRLLLVVRDVDRGERQALLQLADLLAHVAAQLGVEIGQRLVEQQHLRLQHDGARHRDALLLAAGQFAGQARAVAGQPDQRQLRLRQLDRLRLAHARGTQAVADVLQHRHVREQRVGLEHHRHVALGRRQQRDVVAVDQDLPARSPAPARRSAAGSSSCRSRTGPSSVTSVPRSIAKLTVSSAVTAP